MMHFLPVRFKPAGSIASWCASWKRSGLPVFLGVLLSFQLAAQQITVTGKVTSSEDGNPVPGASVLVKGTTTGTTTDANGVYTLEVPTNATLVFSFIGYTAQEVAIGAQSTVDISLLPDITELS